MLIQLIAIPLFNKALLRNKIKDTGSYWRTVAGGFFLYFVFDFVFLDNYAAVIN